MLLKKLNLKRPSLSSVEKGFGLGASIAISALIITKCAVAIQSGIRTLRGSKPKKKVLVVVSDSHTDNPQEDAEGTPVEEEEKQPTTTEDPNPTIEEPKKANPSGKRNVAKK